MRILLIIILYVFTNKLHAQFYNCGGVYEEKTTELNYSTIDTQQVKKINFYLPLMDFRFYKKFYCFYAFEGKFTHQDLNKIITKRLSKYVEISQPKFSYWDSIIVKTELRKIKFHFADSDSSFVNPNISTELFNVLKQYPASEHIFIDYFNKTAKTVNYMTDGMLKIYVINLEEKKIKYYKMIHFCIESKEVSPPDQTLRRILKPYITHLKKVNKLHTIKK
jgi:hypothetical protein